MCDCRYYKGENKAKMVYEYQENSWVLSKYTD